MGGFVSWTDQNWFNVVQTVGILGSLWMATSAARSEARARNIENLLTIADHHRELWSGARQQVERIFREDAQALNTPITIEEEEFLNLVTAHFQTSWSIAKFGGMISLIELAADVQEFFSLPLPRAAWEKTKTHRNPKFVRFVERALKASIHTGRDRREGNLRD